MEGISAVKAKRRISLALVISLLSLSGAALGAPSLESLVPGRAGDAFPLLGKPRLHTPKTLFEHIDGQAEIFIKYGFQRSVSAVYQDPKNAKGQIDLDVYDMGNALQAFGIFSRFRGEDRPMGVGLDSYLEDPSAFFYKGRFFVMLSASEPNSPVLRPLALAVSQKITDTSPPPKEIEYFPKEGLKPGSIQYVAEGLLGYSFLRRGFQADYLNGDKEHRLFLAWFNNPQEAAGALKRLQEELAKKGKALMEKGRRPGPETLTGEDPHKGKMLLVLKGSSLAGAVGFEDQRKAERRLEGLLRRVQ